MTSPGPPRCRREAYDCDITYGTNNEYGFDYLRDNLAVPGQELNQPELIFAIVDEVDSILIDEARTPLIISGQAEASSDLYVKMDRIIRQLQNERDYKIEEKQKTAVFTEDGQRRVELALGVQNLSDPENLSLMQHAGRCPASPCRLEARHRLPRQKERRRQGRSRHH